MILIFLLLALLLIIPDAYIVLSVISSSAWWVKLLFLLPSAAFIYVLLKAFLLGDHSQSTLSQLITLSLCILIPILLFTLVSLLGRAVGHFWHPARMVGSYAGLVIALSWLAISLYGSIYGWKKITVDSVTIASPQIPEAFSGYRIVQLSDFHIGTYHSAPQLVSRIVDEVNALRPDLIVFTGDLVNIGADEVTPFISALSRLHAPDGIYSVLGNHDYCLYREYADADGPARELRAVIDAEHKIGWHILRNEAITLQRDGQRINLVGVDNAGGKSFTDTSDLPAALSNIDTSDFTILLSHDPSHWRREVLPSTSIPLMLAGHTHDMQFRIFGWSPSAWMYPEHAGLYQAFPTSSSPRMLYVSTGIGQNLPFRFGTFPQISLLTLQHRDGGAN